MADIRKSGDTNGILENADKTEKETLHDKRGIHYKKTITASNISFRSLVILCFSDIRKGKNDVTETFIKLKLISMKKKQQYVIHFTAM